METRKRRLHALCVARAGSPELTRLLDVLAGDEAPAGGDAPAFEVEAWVAGSADDLHAALGAGTWDLVLVDAAGTPALGVLAAMSLVREHDAELAVITLPLPPPAGLPALVDGELRAATRRRGQRTQAAEQLALDRLTTVGMLASAVSHEINNPLAAVLANVELALRAVEALPEAAPALADVDVAELRAELNDAHQAAHQVRQIVRDVKLFSRPADDRPSPLDVRELLDATLRLAGHELRHRARVVKRFAPVPPVWATEARLAQLLWNVVASAAVAIPSGRTDHHRLEATTRTNDSGRAVVEISDTAAPATAAAAEVPAGLRVADHLARELGGELVVRRLPAGTTVSITLPGAAAVRADP